LKNWGILKVDDVIEFVENDVELDVVIVRTERGSYHEEKLTNKIRTLGCAVGNVFGDLMEGLDQVELASVPLQTFGFMICET